MVSPSSVPVIFSKLVAPPKLSVRLTPDTELPASIRLRVSLPAPPSSVPTWKLLPVCTPIELQLPPSPKSIVSSPAPILIESVFLKWAYVIWSLPSPISAVKLPLKFADLFTPRWIVSPLDEPLNVILSDPFAPKLYAASRPLAYIFCVYHMTASPLDVTIFSESPQNAFVNPPFPLLIPIWSISV